MNYKIFFNYMNKCEDCSNLCKLVNNFISNKFEDGDQINVSFAKLKSPSIHVYKIKETGFINYMFDVEPNEFKKLCGGCNET